MDAKDVGAPAPKGKLAKSQKPVSSDDLWVAATTDEVISQLEKRAIREGLAGGRAAIGAIMAIPQLADDAHAGLAQKALLRIATALSANKNSKFLGVEAATIARSIAPDVGTAAGRPEEAKLGVVSAFRIVGPFKDTSGTGITTAEGPEIAPPPVGAAAPKPDGKAKDGKETKTTAKDDGKPRPISVALFRQMDQRWDDGAYDNAWRPVPAELTSARGIPLDVLIYPRKEACTYLASVVTLANDQVIVVQAAASGSLRVMFDGAALGTSEETHSLALADRIAAKMTVSKGPHLLALKVCAGTSADAGRVRARVTTETGDAVAGITFGDDLGKLPETVTPPTFTSLTTPLAKALAFSPKDELSVDDALSIALARRIGGADDLRSPRAQGFLDVVVNGDPRPDELAMSGWLAPGRANETTWLNKSITVAGADKLYEPVAKFSRRVLADGRLDAHYTDWAASTVATTELATAKDLDAQILRARLQDQLGHTEDAFLAWKNIWDAEKESTPTYVLRQLASSMYQRPLLAAAARAQALSVWPRESPRDYIRSKGLLGPEALKAATIASFRLIASADEIESIGDELKNAGLAAEHRRFLLMATGWAPNRKAIWSELVQALAASPDAKERELAKEALGRARDLDPGSPFLRAEEDLAFGELHPDDEAYLPDPKSFLARRKGAPAPTPDGKEPLLDVLDRQLDWVRVVTVDDAGRVVQLIHYSREIVKAPKDAGDLDERGVPAEGDVVEVVRARVHHLDGTTAVPQQIAEGEDGLGIRWTDLKPGDVVEVATRSYTELPIGDRGAAPFFFLDYAGGPATHPCLYNEVVVRSQAKHPLYTALLHEELGKPDIRTTANDAKGRSVERYVWNNPMTVPVEPFQPKATEIYPTIIGSQFKTWDDFVTWYKAGVGSFSTVDPRIKRQAEEIVEKAKAKTRDEKLAAIFNWIADQVKYVNYVSAEQWLPNRPQNVLDRMQGDCDDKAMLLITMLKAIGIEDAQEVLVQTRYTGMPSVITAKGAVAPLFDHGIAFLPGSKDGKGEKADRYLDATSPESRLGPLPAMDARAAAIRVVFGGTTPIVTLPNSSPEEHGQNGTWSFTIKEDGSAAITIDELHSGDSAFWLRTSLAGKTADPKDATGVQTESATWLEKYHAVAALPQLEVVPQGIAFKGELKDGKATLKFNAKSAGLGRKEGTDLVLGLHYGIPTTASLAPLTKRVTPVVLPPHMAPSMDVVKIVFDPPPGYKVAELNIGGEVNGGKYGKASLVIERGEKNQIIVKRVFSLDQSTISLAEYDAWRAFVVKVDALFNREIRFVKGS